ncbi:MAG: ABC transporter substrate-binding protein [Microthrixaceae bacterium]
MHDDSKTEFVEASAPEEADVDEVAVEGDREGDGTLQIGSLLPKTGSLAFLGPPEFAGVDLAVQEMNEAGGVLGNDVVHIEGDSQGHTENAVAPKTISTLLAQDVDAIIGAASSSVSLSVIDTVVNAGVVMFSPANTSKAFSDYNDKGLYFRNAPSDILQGSVLADTILQDGYSNVFILALNDDYGTGLAEDLTKSLEAGGASVVGEEIYDPKATDFADVVGSAKNADPDAIALIGFDESSKILSTMIEQGIGPSDMPIYGVDGNMGNALAENFEAGK